MWNFVPPASPHFCGLKEDNIGSVKRILLKVTKSTVLIFEELTTLATQTEAVLNSRPLWPLSADPADLQPFTHGHFWWEQHICQYQSPVIVWPTFLYYPDGLSSRILGPVSGKDGVKNI
ncbi:hypothetical protein AVEN_136950-1 [Araneus ventricosus]|uniref:Uncharacterized protein n=1 Tax=Araneus ventricosus TaxID=182803 RepID=A0A4Y2BHE7_ARAVE|nr:hypothetical protein AVEN_136950-1 [Araneus ventricosus]